MAFRNKKSVEVSKAGNYYRRIRLDNGRFITVQLTSSDPGEVDKASPDEIWHSADGRKLLPKDMDLKHLLNVKKMLQGRGTMAMGYHKISVVDIDADTFTEQLYPIYKHICDEVAYRLGTKRRPPNKPAGEKPLRKFDFDV